MNYLKCSLLFSILICTVWELYKEEDIKPWLTLAVYSADLVYFWCIPERFPKLHIFSVIFITVSFWLFRSFSSQNWHSIAEEPLLDYLFISSEVLLTPKLPLCCILTGKLEVVMKTISRIWSPCGGSIPLFCFWTETFYWNIIKCVLRIFIKCKCY